MFINTKLRTAVAAAATVLMLSSGAVMAQGNSANAPGHANPPGLGQNKNLGHNNASNGIMARIQANKHIFYSGDPLEISIRFPRGSELITSGQADAYLLIFEPDAYLGVLPVSSDARPGNTRIFEMDAVDPDSLPEGVYQLGLVITVPGGDPLNVEDWYNGMLGLLAVQGLTVSAGPLDIDRDGDGFVDGDETGDGFVDEEEPVVEDPVVEDPVAEDPVVEDPAEGDSGNGQDPVDEDSGDEELDEEAEEETVEDEDSQDSDEEEDEEDTEE